MKTDLQRLTFIILKPFILFIILSLSIFAFLSLQATTRRPPPSPDLPSDLKIRPGYSSYDSYLQRQLNKTLNPKLRHIWTTRDWDRKVSKFAQFFSDLQRRDLISNSSRSLCIGARVGQEVAALQRIGVENSVGIDLVPYPPLVIKGDFHHQPFRDGSFDFEFSNVFDHALYPWKFVGEVERTLTRGGVCVLHVLLSRRADKYSANDLFSVKPLEEMFKKSELIEVRSIDGFGLDTEVVFRKIRN
ncbi:hypothetical protein SASPL_136534 [Salvia splendens]|uniref:Methyltransferase type 11 domain-containing protein n=1 Tax=Salvia splendens TaxID=180675 RepID=A0A8X8X000_SALSN|nr:uncharacterized protein LOC121759985 [Salvia splendens]KAG6404288.1 hypothetical protein SASPL_136534 [Salvia splendens]